jgi:hypothetical protein
VLGDSERADEIEDESLEDYAERRKIALINTGRRNRCMATKSELEEQISELEDENRELQDRLDAVADLVNGEEETDEDEGEDNGEQDEQD